MAKSRDTVEKPGDASSPASGPPRRQVREIARLVAKLEAVGELETRRRRQLQAALEKGHKAKRHRQAVDRSAARVGVLIDRLRTLARELDAPVPRAVKPKPAPPSKQAATTATSKATVGAKAKPAASAARSKPAASSTGTAARPRSAGTAARRPRPTKAP